MRRHAGRAAQQGAWHLVPLGRGARHLVVDRHLSPLPALAIVQPECVLAIRCHRAAAARREEQLSQQSGEALERTDHRQQPALAFRRRESREMGGKRALRRRGRASRGEKP